jgi:ATP-dependent Clp protease ATP-binding subunit ClpC
LQRAIQKYLEDPIADEILETDAEPGDTLVVGYDQENDKMLVSARKPKKKKDSKKTEPSAEEGSEE